MTPKSTISRREAEVLAAVGERLTNAEIAARLNIGVRTVESHVSALLRKLGAADRHELVALEVAGRRMSDRFTQLPYLSVPVFGRDNDVIGVRQLLAESRLVTLCGPGGVGKSTLALLALSQAVVPESGHVYVDLTPVRSRDDVAAGFASALGVDRAVQISWTDRLVEAIGARKLLVVVDNAESVIDATAALLGELLRRVKDVSFLVTTREPLAMPSERLWDVRPLAATADQAIALFCDRAAAVRPGWAPGDDGLRTVRSICERLDGLPLAIELAATEVRARSIDEIDRRLDRPLALLEHGDRTEARHRTLRAVMDSSYGLLTPDERAVFDLLGVFVAGFSISDAQRLCVVLVDEDNTEGIVVALVARSLLRRGPQISPSRYEMLNTIRDYALEHLETSQTVATARDRHAKVVMEVVAETVGDLWGSGEARAVAWFDAAQADVIAAYRWLKDRGNFSDLLELAVRSYLFGWSHGRATLRELIGDAITVAERAAISPDLLAMAYGAAAGAANTAGDADGARRLSNIGLDHARDALNPSARLCHGVAADLALFAGDASAASKHYRLAADGFRTVGVAAMAAYLDAASGLALTYGGGRAGARRILERSVAAADATGCPSAQAFARYASAELFANEDPALALAHLEESMSLAQSVGATFVAGIAELSFATLHARAGRPHLALARYEALIEQWRRAGNWTQQWNTLRTLVFVLADLERFHGAAELMAAIAAHDAEPTWGDDAARWATVRESLHRHLSPVIIETAARAARELDRSDVLTLAERQVSAGSGW